MNLQEYKQALKKHLLTFKWLDKKMIDEIVAKFKAIDTSLLNRPPSTVVSCGFNWKLTTEGRDYWIDVHNHLVEERNPRSTPPVHKTLTQPEVQQLLSILRSQLYITSFHKDMQKIDAAELWEECDKKDKFTASSFTAYSQIYASYKQHKQEEKKLVNLITKLKGLK